jgi:hypothetical protein
MEEEEETLVMLENKLLRSCPGHRKNKSRNETWSIIKEYKLWRTERLTRVMHFLAEDMSFDIKAFD